jgi:DNA-binding CsgD family transcriptional regulator/tetratricopeptide (TPR) repeat protein
MSFRVLAGTCNPKIDPKIALHSVTPMGGELLLTVLLERESELAEFDAVLPEVEAGRGCAVAIEAIAGLGKTRLLQEVRKASERAGLSVLSARATEFERDFPFALVRQLFEGSLAGRSPRERESLLEGANAARGALGLEPAAGAPTHDSFAVLHGLYWVTAGLAERGPLVLAIDDVHWSDTASLDYLGFLLPRLEELPVLLIVTSRPDEPDPPEGLDRILTDNLVRHLTPGALSAEATNKLLAHELDHSPEWNFAAACHEVSGGNPFLLCELAHTLVEQGVEPLSESVDLVRDLAPERVARMVLKRITRLPSDAQAVARSLAVLGEDNDLRLVAELADIDPEPAQQAADALRATAILDAGPSPRFIHPLVRNAIYLDIPVGERERAHARAATLLRNRGAGCERIATQLLASDLRGEHTSVETLLEAGERALGTGAPRSAIAYLTRALREPPPTELRAAVLGPLITAGIRAADHSLLASIEEDVFAELERDPSLRSRWAVMLTMWMAFGGRFEEAASMLTEGVEVAVSEGDLERAFQLEAQLSTIARLAPSLPEVQLERYTDQIDPDSPVGRLAAAMEVRSVMANAGSASDAVDAAKRALGNDSIIFAEEPELVAAPVAVMTLVAADEMDAARYSAERALAIARERDATPDLARARFLNGFVAWGYGELATAEADLRQAVDLARLALIVPAMVMYVPFLSEVLIERDELESAERELQATGLLGQNAPFSLVVEVHLRFAQGRFEEAVDNFVTLSNQADEMGAGPGLVFTACRVAAQAMVAIGEEKRAREMAESMMVHARQWGVRSSKAHVLSGLAATHKGAAGIEMLEEAAALMDGSPRHLGRAQILCELGAALRRDGRRVEARLPLQEALKLARQCGAARVAKHTHDELEASGETVRRYAPIGVESLTPSEKRVAELAASGLTNRQIAQSLFVTVKTVEAHLSATYDKLDIESRKQLSAALSER